MTNSTSHVLPANTTEWTASARPRSTVALPAFLRTPKGQVVAVFLILVGIALPAESGWGLAISVLCAIAAACGVDVLYTYWETRRWIVPTSALISGLIVAMVLGAQESWMVFAWIAGFSVVGKHVFRTDREHIFNPAALALLGGAVIFGSGQSWWGALGDVAWPWIAVLLVGGVLVVDRLNKFPLVLTFLGAYFLLFDLVSVVDSAAVTEMFRSPFIQSALFLAFFMLTDPPTSPNRFWDQVWYGLIAAGGACAAQLLGAGQLFLILGLLAANGWLALRRWQQRRRAPLTPLQRRRATLAAMTAHQAVAARAASRTRAGTRLIDGVGINRTPPRGDRAAGSTLATNLHS